MPRKPADSTSTAKLRRRRRSRTPSLETEIRKSAKQIYESGMSEAMRAAALMICARKLDEVRMILAVSGLSNGIGQNSTVGLIANPPATPSPPIVQNPCVTCGRPGIYKSKPNQFNRTGSWYCRAHQVLGVSIDTDDQMDRHLAPQPAPAPQAAPSADGVSSLAEAMGIAQVVDEAN